MPGISNLDKPKPVAYVPRQPKEPISTNSMINRMIGHLDPLGLLNADQKRLREILTSEAGFDNRNKRWQYGIVRIVIDTLIEMGAIR